MKKALNIYHLINFLHVLFYTYLVAQIFNIADIRILITGHYQIILIAYLVTVLVLGIYAKSISKGLKNPIQTVKLAKYLNIGGIAFLVLGFVLMRQIDHSFVYLIMISVPMSAFAFVFAYKGAPKIKEENNSILDEFRDD